MGIINKKDSKYILVAVLVFIGSVSCNQKRAGFLGFGDEHQNPFTPEFKEEVSGFAGLDAFERAGLNKTISAMDAVNPEFPTTVPRNLLHEIEEQLDDDSPEAMLVNAALIDRLLQHCTAVAAALAPRDGEPHLGEWGDSVRERTM